MSIDAHPAAELFPLLSGAEYESFKADIAANGLIEPIVLCDGKILDGRNRYRACEELGIEPKFVSYEGDDPVAFAWSLNGARRHLSQSQLAVVATKMFPTIREETLKRQAQAPGMPRGTKQSSIEGQEDTQRTNEIAASIVGVGARTVRRAAYIAKHDPELLKEVEAGNITVGEAERRIIDSKKKGNGSIPEPESVTNRKPVEQRIDRIRELAADGHRASQIADDVGLTEQTVRRYAAAAGITLPDAAMGKVHKIDPRRVIDATVDGFEGTVIALNTIWGSDWGISAEDARELCASIDKSMKSVNRLRRELKEIANGN